MSLASASVTVRSTRPLLIENVSKTYGDGRSAIAALDRLTLEIKDREFVCLLGASGCGKSTLLNLIAGIYHLDNGAIDTGGRRVGMVFQEPALFPWLTVARNIDLAMRLQGAPAESRLQRRDDLLGLVHLEGFGNRRPHELSGGMQQRAALARALAQNSELLLMDEPFGALDAMTRDSLHDELERIWSGSDLTIVFVTHNVREAVRLGNRVVLLSSRPGRVVAEFEVDIERPRRIDSEAVARMAAVITDRLREEVRRHGR
jgi:NitT/TauT family transport system ATP-binding protein